MHGVPAGVTLRPNLPRGKPLLQDLEWASRILQGLRDRGLLLMPTPSAFTMAGGFSRAAKQTGLPGELWPEDLCAPHQVAPGLGAPFGAGKRKGGAGAVGKPQR